MNKFRVVCDTPHERPIGASTHPLWNRPNSARVKSGMDNDERNTIRDEGFDCDDPHVTSAMRQVTATLRAYRHLLDGYPWCHTASELYLPAPTLPAFDFEHSFE